MAEIKSLSQSAAKWKRRAGSAGQEYEEGVRNTTKSWANNTAAAEKSYEQGVTAAIGRKAFGAGVKAAGDDKWRENAIEKGPQRFTQGVSLAEQNYEKGFGPYRETIANTQLPARGPKGDPNNIQRVAKIATALHNKKLSMQKQ